MHAFIVTMVFMALMVIRVDMAVLPFFDHVGCNPEASGLDSFPDMRVERQPRHDHLQYPIERSPTCSPYRLVPRLTP